MRQEDIARYAIRFKSGKFYNEPIGIRIFESYEKANEFLKNQNITEDFDLVNNKEIIYKTEEKNNNTIYLYLIWSKTKEIIWEHSK